MDPLAQPDQNDALAMTHWPQASNPAAPYIQAARDFAGGGLQRALGLPNNAIGRALQNPDNMMAVGMTSPIKGMDQLRRIAHETTQEGIKKSIDAQRPKTFQEYLIQRSKYLKTRQDILDSDLVWAKARELQELRSNRQQFETPFSNAYTDIANFILQHRGMEPVSPEEMSKVMTDWAAVQKSWK